MKYVWPVLTVIAVSLAMMSYFDRTTMRMEMDALRADMQSDDDAVRAEAAQAVTASMVLLQQNETAPFMPARLQLAQDHDSTINSSVAIMSETFATKDYVDDAIADAVEDFLTQSEIEALIQAAINNMPSTGGNLVCARFGGVTTWGGTGYLIFDSRLTPTWNYSEYGSTYTTAPEAQMNGAGGLYVFSPNRRSYRTESMSTLYPRSTVWTQVTEQQGTYGRTIKTFCTVM